MKKPTSLELEEIMDLAADACAKRARDAELDTMRHTCFNSNPVAHTGIGPEPDRKQLYDSSKKQIAKWTRLCAIARELREAAHGHNLSVILEEAAAVKHSRG